MCVVYKILSTHLAGKIFTLVEFTHSPNILSNKEACENLRIKEERFVVEDFEMENKKFGKRKTLEQKYEYFFLLA